MAANLSNKVAVKTGAAKDETLLALDTGLTEDNQVTLAVLSNDPGSASLYSLYQLKPTDTINTSTLFPVVTSTSLPSGASIWIDTVGKLHYDSHGAFNYLGAGLSATDSFSYTIRMASGALSTATITVSILGVNDAATISQNGAGDVHEDGILTASGNLTITDPDLNEARFSAPSSLTQIYGSFQFNTTTGDWGYTLANSQANVQSLKQGETVHDYLTVFSYDNTASSTIDITVTGENDRPELSGPAPFTYTDTAADDVPTARSDVLTGTDVDHGAVLTYAGSAVHDYGTLVVQADGSYTFMPDQAKWNALHASETYTETFSVSVMDEYLASSLPFDLSFTFVGAQDPATISGDTTGSVFEDGTAAQETASGTLAVHDRDHDESSFYVNQFFINGVGATTFTTSGSMNTIPGTYGSFTFDTSSGNWTYQIDETLADGLSATDAPTEVLRVWSKDGMTFADINVTVQGADDVIVGAGGGGGDNGDGDARFFIVNYGLTDNNGHQVFLHFDGNDILKYSSNYTFVSMETVNYDLDPGNTKETTSVTFNFDHNGEPHPVTVYLVGYTGLSGDQFKPLVTLP